MVGSCQRDLRKDAKLVLDASKSGASMAHVKIASRKSDQNVQIVRVEMAADATAGVSRDRECTFPTLTGDVQEGREL